MKRKSILAVLLAVTFFFSICLAGCGSSQSSEELSTYRELSWEGAELTISLGENKSTNCNGTTHSQDDKIIDYSVNRVFHLKPDTQTGEAAGVLDAGFQGKGAGITTIECTTPVGWDGTGEGYTYIVTVTVGEDGIIESATGEEQ